MSKEEEENKIVKPREAVEAAAAAAVIESLEKFLASVKKPLQL